MLSPCTLTTVNHTQTNVRERATRFHREREREKIAVDLRTHTSSTFTQRTHHFQKYRSTEINRKASGLRFGGENMKWSPLLDWNVTAGRPGYSCLSPLQAPCSGGCTWCGTPAEGSPRHDGRSALPRP